MLRALSIIQITIFLLASHINFAYAQNQNTHPELGDILRHVYQTNPTLKAAQEEFNATKELSAQARAGWLPSLSAETSLFATDIENSNFGAGTGATTKDFSVNLNQPIFRGGRTFAEKARASDLIKAGEALLMQIEQSVYLNTAVAYADLFRDAKIWNLRKANEDILKKEFEAAQERFELGDTTITDIHQAKARYQRAQSEHINALADLEISEAKFIEIAQMRPPGLSRPNYNFPFPQDLETMVSMAEKNNPEIWIAQYEFEAEEHNTDAIMRELFPQLSAFADYNKQYDPQPGIIDEGETQTIGVRATLALYQGGATRSRIRESRRTAKQRYHEISEIRNRIRQQTTSNYRAYSSAIKVTQSREQEIEAASLALEGVRAEAHLGQRTMLDILDADEELINAKISLARAKRDEVVSKFSLAANLGMLSQNLPKN